MNTQPQNRREFLQAAIRTTLLGSVGLIGMVLLRRSADCTNRGGCGGCNLYADCALPWRAAKR